MAYALAVRQFFDCCEQRSLRLDAIRPTTVAAYIEQLGARMAKPSVKQHLAAVRTSWRDGWRCAQLKARSQQTCFSRQKACYAHGESCCLLRLAWNDWSLRRQPRHNKRYLSASPNT